MTISYWCTLCSDPGKGQGQTETNVVLILKWCHPCHFHNPLITYNLYVYLKKKFQETPNLTNVSITCNCYCKWNGLTLNIFKVETKLWIPQYRSYLITCDGRRITSQLLSLQIIHVLMNVAIFLQFLMQLNGNLQSREVSTENLHLHIMSFRKQGTLLTAMWIVWGTKLENE